MRIGFTSPAYILKLIALSETAINFMTFTTTKGAESQLFAFLYSFIIGIIFGVRVEGGTFSPTELTNKVRLRFSCFCLVLRLRPDTGRESL